MNLAERLAQIKHEFETGETPSRIVEVLNADIARLLKENVAENALQVGEFAALDSLVQTDGNQVSLSSFFGDRFLVLTWFRGNW